MRIKGDERHLDARQTGKNRRENGTLHHGIDHGARLIHHHDQIGIELFA